MRYVCPSVGPRSILENVGERLPAMAPNAEYLTLFFPGLYLRSQLVNRSKSGTITTITPLHLLHGFFAVDAVIPQRNLISVSLSLKPNSQILRQKSGAAKKVKLVIVKSEMRLLFLTFESSLRNSWISSVKKVGIHRSLQLAKSVHIAVQKGSQTTRAQNLFSTLVLPQTLIFFFTESKREFGDYNSTKYYYKSQNVASVRVFSSGRPCNDLTIFSSMDTETRGSFTNLALYENFLSCFGKKAHLTVTPEVFHETMFIYCLNLSSEPHSSSNPGVTLDAVDRKVSMISAGVLDLDIVFRNPTTDNLLLNLIGFYDTSIIFNEDGAVVDD